MVDWSWGCFILRSQSLIDDGKILMLPNDGVCTVKVIASRGPCFVFFHQRRLLGHDFDLSVLVKRLRWVKKILGRYWVMEKGWARFQERRKARLSPENGEKMILLPQETQERSSEEGEFFILRDTSKVIVRDWRKGEFAISRYESGVFIGEWRGSSKILIRKKRSSSKIEAWALGCC